MSKVKKQPIIDDDLRTEYQRSDFAKMQRGKYAVRAAELTNVIMLDPDVAEAFPNERIVNETLRSLLKLAKTSIHRNDPPIRKRAAGA